MWCFLLPHATGLEFALYVPQSGVEKPFGSLRLALPPDRAGRMKGGISVVVVSYHTGPLLWGCLDDVLAQPDVAELLVVDNGNPPTTRRELQQRAAADARLNVITPQHNLGFAAACNWAAEQAQGPLLALVNPDVSLPPATFARLLAEWSQHPDAWVVGCRVMNPDGSEQKGGRREILTPWWALVEVLRLDRIAPNHPHFRRFHRLDGDNSQVMAVPVTSGAFMLMELSRFRSLGGLDAHMFLHVEDVDFCLRVLQQGGLVLYCGSVPIIHHYSSSDAANWFVQWHKTRSTIVYFRKNFAASYPRWVLHAVTAVMLMRLVVLVVRGLPKDMARWKR